MVRRCLWMVMVLATMAARAGGQVMPLGGQWLFRLDASNVGMEQKWFTEDLPDRITLPGSTDQAGYGPKNQDPPTLDGLSRVHVHVGPAWYQREVEIPPAWKDKRITLFLERCHWESRVWVNGHERGMQDSLCTPHVYDLTDALAVGRNRLTIRIDNSHKYNMGRNAHSTSEQTQTNWNGIIGRIELRATDPVWIDDLQVYPEPENQSARVRIAIRNATGKTVKGTGNFAVRGRDSGAERRPAELEFETSLPRIEVRGVLPLGGSAALWDEFSPALYDLELSIKAKAGETQYSDRRRVSFGMRRLTIERGRQIAVNGRPVFLRGTLDCCVYPLTGYPPMDVQSWLRVFRACKAYGLNHVRYHSWCPPEAAFEAADQLGMLLQVEAPQWVHDVGQDPARDAFIEAEVRRILDAYGNHPSFALMCMGNELRGEPAQLSRLVTSARQHDARRLYTASAAFAFVPENDYTVTTVRGLRGPGTEQDFRSEDARHRGPVISHEVGQWAVYPNLAEIGKYTGVTRARNLELVRDDLKGRGMLEQAGDFLLATGRHSALLYKQEIETLLRTPRHAGFQLLDLHDFPGQGTALVGMLDAFWESKGLIRPEAWRRFCGPTVPLLRTKKRIWTTDEVFSASAEIAHYGGTTIENAAAAWTIRDAAGKALAAGQLMEQTLVPGELYFLGVLAAPLKNLPAPARLTVSVGIRGTEIENDWDIWVYPASNDLAAPADVLVTGQWAQAKARLADGGRVLLLAGEQELAGSLPGSFTPVFWSPVWFKRGPGTMSILCDPKHPALRQFPTDMHTNWQWYDLLRRSRTMVLDGLPTDFRPIVQVIDNFSRNHRLGNLFEARVGRGRLLVCSIDLQTDLDQRPEARQLLRSLLDYAGGKDFEPKAAVPADLLDRLFSVHKSAQIFTNKSKWNDAESARPICADL